MRHPYKILCDFCDYDNLKNAEAVAVYTTPDDREHDVCEKHLKSLKEYSGLNYSLIKK